MFPVSRLRRLRKNESIRDLIRENRIIKDNLVMPVFVDENLKKKREIESLPGIYKYPLEEYEDYVKHLSDLGVNSILLFGIPSLKDAIGSSAYDSNGVIQRAIRIAKENTKINVISDLCMCEYTDHGHCGVLSGDYVDNDKTLELYRKIALSYAEAGVDMVAPSGMMDGQVKAIRSALDGGDFLNTLIMAYSSKYSSNLYGPFREAADSAPQFGDRKTYQMSYSNHREALREIEFDIEEGADIVMVKPAIFYLDIIAKAREKFLLPLAAYSVSGEYSMIKEAVSKGLLNEDVITEGLTSIFRAGADIVITYFTEEMMLRK